MISFKLNGKSIKVKTSYDELTLNEYMEFVRSGNDALKHISICTGIDVETLRKASGTGLESVIEAVRFLRKPVSFDKYTLKCGPYNLPTNKNGQFNIQYETLAQFEDMRSLLATFPSERPVEIPGYYAKFVAIYLQAIRDKEYSHSKAMEMVSEVMDMPAKEVMTLGSFFLLKLLSLLNGTEKTSLPTSPSPKKKKLVSVGSRKRLASR